MDEYLMSWSDALRAESAQAQHRTLPQSADEFHQFGTLGRALWRERSLARILARNPAARTDDVRKIIADLHAATRALDGE